VRRPSQGQTLLHCIGSIDFLVVFYCCVAHNIPFIFNHFSSNTYSQHLFCKSPSRTRSSPSTLSTAGNISTGNMTSLDGDFSKNGRDCERLKDAFDAFLPRGFNCQVRYTHSPPKPCEPLFSPCPGMQPEKTRLASHFLTVSVPVPDQAKSAGNGNANSQRQVLVFAMEVLVYSSQGLITMFVSKADSTGHLPPRRPSPIKSIATTFMWWLATQQRRLTKSVGTKLVISLFARAQSQYLFPGSADHGKKHVLDDRQLIRWWARVLDPLFSSNETSNSPQNLDLQGYMTVPGYHGVETKSFFPSKPNRSEKSRNWLPGNPLVELAEARGIPETAPTRCLLPRFPDDPKARFMQDLDDEVGLVEDAGSLAVASPSKQKNGRWKSINDLERFWEAMEFRQECSSGRVVGFLWLVARPPPNSSQEIQPEFARDSSPSKKKASITTTTATDSQDSQDSQTSRTSRTSQKSAPNPKRRQPLKGHIKIRQPRLKGGSSNLSATSNPSDNNDNNPPSARDGPSLTQEGYDSAMSILLNLDFSSVAAAAHSTAKWVSEVSRMSGLKAAKWALDCEGSAEIESVVASVSGSSQPATNDLGGLVRKKRKVGEDGGASSAAAEQVGGEGRLESNGGVNVLVGRKKAKS
jgi:regulator of Ty1 transposition protein 109